MTIKIKIPKASTETVGKKIPGLPSDPVLRAALVVFLILAVTFTVFCSYFYIKYDRIIERRFRTPVFSNSAKIYALPRTVRDGEKIEAREIAADLRQAGYSDKEGQSALGTFKLEGCDVYTSCEPCPMCLAALYWSRCRAIFYGNNAADAAL